MIKECNETDLFVLTKRKYRKPGQKVVMCFVSNCVWWLGRAKKESGQTVHRFYQHYWGGEHAKKMKLVIMISITSVDKISKL